MGEEGSTVQVENKKYTKTVAEAKKLEEEAKRYITAPLIRQKWQLRNLVKWESLRRRT
jgi:hypothetical protein